MTKRQLLAAKTRFLDAFRQRGVIQHACDATNVARSTVYSWLERDEQFSMAFRVAEAESTERLEAEVYRRAHDGVLRERPIFHKDEQVGTEYITEFSDGLAMFILRARKPDKYREKFVGVDPDQAPIKAYVNVDLEAV